MEGITLLTFGNKTNDRVGVMYTWVVLASGPSGSERWGLSGVLPQQRSVELHHVVGHPAGVVVHSPPVTSRLRKIWHPWKKSFIEVPRK